ncbi:MAG: Voltage-gated potassium channel Kch [Dehalococcoidales bacterium]|nr:Voltage-gated potassium channel Kch [Dehalococcoidales bacterium]
MSGLIYRKFLWSGIILVAIQIIGTIGYLLIGGEQYSFLDAFYMVFITIATIGYGEIIDLSNSAAGRIFTMFIAVAGIGVLAYTATNLTALVVEGELTKSFRRKRMEKRAGNLEGHYIICGLGEVGLNIASELTATKRPYVIVDISQSNIQRILATLGEQIFIEGDATDNDTLLKAGVAKARGLFAVAGDDNQNLVISLTAKQINPKVRVVARCTNIKNSEKIKRAGADAVVSPGFIGGVRMASEMLRPTVVSFLDMMLRETDRNLRVEAIALPDRFVGKPISALDLRRHPHTLVLAIKTKDGWLYNPARDYVVQTTDTLVYISTTEGKDALETFLHGEP